MTIFFHTHTKKGTVSTHESQISSVKQTLKKLSSGASSGLTSCPSSQLLQRNLRGLKAVRICREKGRGGNRCLNNNKNTI